MRLHFFDVPHQSIANCADAASRASALKAAAKAGLYVGFVVVRPVSEAPVGRAVIASLQQDDQLIDSLDVRSTHKVHVLGAELEVRGVPFTQQDSRISACAQASIWMCGRHFHARHGGPWFSTSEITKAALQPTDGVIASSLPAGSGGLSGDNMLRALHAMQRHPLSYAPSRVDPTTGALIWPSQLQPEAIITRYVDSGIPVIVCLRSWIPGQSIGHAVVAVGTTFASHSIPALTTTGQTTSLFFPYFLVHDDQRGIYLRMPVASGASASETPYNVTDHVGLIIVPLPDRVFMSAEIADRLAQDFFSKYATDWIGYKVNLGSGCLSTLLGNEVITCTNKNGMISRTYLTFGWKYKNYVIENVSNSEVANIISLQDLPKMVWVTEFSTLDGSNKPDPSDRRIFGHCVIDATSSRTSANFLIFHAPGYLAVWTKGAPDFFPTSPQTVYPITSDAIYRPRIRSQS